MAKRERWYFTKDELESNSPSRKCGIDAERELFYRQQAANLIQDMGQKLKVTQLVINTAIVYMHRFYTVHSFTKFHRNVISACALFLAAKVEEQPRKLEHIIKVQQICVYRENLDSKSEQYQTLAAQLVYSENVLLRTIGFELNVSHPHSSIVACSQLVKATKHIAETSYYLATNSLHLSTLCLQYKPTVVACICMYFVCKWSNFQFAKSSEGKDWWTYVDPSVNKDLLEQSMNDCIGIFQKCPQRLKKCLANAAKMNSNSKPMPHNSLMGQIEDNARPASESRHQPSQPNSTTESKPNLAAISTVPSKSGSEKYNFLHESISSKYLPNPNHNLKMPESNASLISNHGLKATEPSLLNSSSAISNHSLKASLSNVGFQPNPSLEHSSSSVLSASFLSSLENAISPMFSDAEDSSNHSMPNFNIETTASAVMNASSILNHSLEPAEQPPAKLNLNSVNSLSNHSLKKPAESSLLNPNSISNSAVKATASLLNSSILQNHSLESATTASVLNAGLLANNNSLKLKASPMFSDADDSSDHSKRHKKKHKHKEKHKHKDKHKHKHKHKEKDKDKEKHRDKYNVESQYFQVMEQSEKVAPLKLKISKGKIDFSPAAEEKKPIKLKINLNNQLRSSSESPSNTEVSVSKKRKHEDKVKPEKTAKLAGDQLPNDIFFNKYGNKMT